MGSYAIWDCSQFRVSNMAAAAALHAGRLLGGGAVCAGGTSCSLAFVVCDL